MRPLVALRAGGLDRAGVAGGCGSPGRRPRPLGPCASRCGAGTGPAGQRYCVALGVVGEVHLARRRVTGGRSRAAGRRRGCPRPRRATMFSTRAVGRVAGDLAGPQLPAEADPPEQVAHRLVLHDVGRGHQRGEDDAAPCRRRRRSGRGSPTPPRCSVRIGVASGSVVLTRHPLRRLVAAGDRALRVQPPLIQQPPGGPAG